MCSDGQKHPHLLCSQLAPSMQTSHLDTASSLVIFQLIEQSGPVWASQVFLGHGCLAKDRHLHALSIHPMLAQAAGRQTDRRPRCAHLVSQADQATKSQERLIHTSSADIQPEHSECSAVLWEKLRRNNHILKLFVLVLNEFFSFPKPSKCLNQDD